MSYKTLLKSFTDAGAELTPRVKEYLAESDKTLREAHLRGATGMDVCTSCSGIIDDILKALYELKSGTLGAPGQTAMVATGGFGRGELNVRSDIDLMLLYSKRITPEIKALTEQMLYILWDTGLDMGFSLRSVDDCIDLAREDLKTMTSLLDRRFIIGDPALFARLNASIVKKLFGARRAAVFIDEKLEESKERREKYGGSVYILEPNVKEGEGGLRDLHTARWVVGAKNGGRMDGPGAEALLSAQDSKTLAGSLEFLLWVRNELHFETNRKTDQLSFEHQERISGLLDFKETDRALAVESFMQQYYRHASNIDHYSGLILSRSLQGEKKRSTLWPGKKTAIDENFELSGSVLRLKDPGALKKDPAVSIKIFEYAQAFNAEIDQPTRDALLGFLEHAGAELRTSKSVSESFLKILRGTRVFTVLNEMRKLRFLDTYIPEFAEISCMVQHDLYHVYTVDVHTLFAIREVERLRGSYKFDFSLIATLYEELKTPEILMLAILFHDIGKAYGKGHSEKGARIVPEICARLHLPEDDAEMVSFLVRNHLILADTAQYRDLHDEKLIIEFAKKVGDIDRLNMLYLLTFADVRAVGPDVWSQWKGALFQELYFKAITVLERGTFDIEEAGSRIARIKERVLELTGSEGIAEQTVDDFFELLPQRYFLSNGHELIAGHIKTLSELGTKPYIMNVCHDPYREYTELVICTNDVHWLFSMITGVMTANGINILGAQINTMKNGIALDILQVRNNLGEAIIDEHRVKKIDSDLSMVLSGRVRVQDLVSKRSRPSILDKKATPVVSARVEVDNEVSLTYTVLDLHARNRIGLLYDITSTLSGLGLYIHIAKISTKGDTASDIFYVRDIFGQKIFYKERLKEIRKALEDAIRDDRATTPPQAAGG